MYTLKTLLLLENYLDILQSIPLNSNVRMFEKIKCLLGRLIIMSAEIVKLIVPAELSTKFTKSGEFKLKALSELKNIKVVLRIDADIL